MVLGSVNGTCWSLDRRDDEPVASFDILKSDSCCCWDDGGGGGGRVGDSSRCDAGERDRSCAIQRKID